MNHSTIGVDQVERALFEACRRAHAEILEFTVAPRACSLAEPWDGYEWLIEFADPPRAPDRFPRALDEALCHLDTVYRARRRSDGSMAPPRVIEVPAGTFFRWRSAARRDVPRVSATRVVADGVLAIAAESRVPLITVG